MSDPISFDAPVDKYEPTPEQIDQMFRAMDDSVSVINLRCTNGPGEYQTQLECNQEIDRNDRHLELMLSKDYIQDAGRDLTPYENAITEGEAYIAEHPTPEGTSV